MNQPTEARNVSVIGLGLMGSALAESLLKAGHDVTVWNRTPAKTDPLTTRGARPAASAADALAASDATIICVTNHAATMEILPAAAPPGRRILVQLSTMTPRARRVGRGPRRGLSRRLDLWRAYNGPGWGCDHHLLRPA